MKVTDYLTNPAQHIMIYGEPFTGKSTLAATVANLGFRVIWISLDRSVVHLQNLPAEAKEMIELIYIPDNRDNPVAYQSIMGMFSGRPTAICHLHGRLECKVCKEHHADDFTPVQFSKLGIETVVVIDHLTQTAESAMNRVIRYSIENKEQDANKITWDKITDEALVMYKPGYSQWQYLWNYMSALLDKIQAAPFHVIVVSHVVESKQEDGNKRLVPHGGSDRFSRNVPRYFDHIITTEVGNGKHKFSSATTDATMLIAGSRTDISISKLFKEGERPTLKPFFTGEVPKVTREYGVDAAATFLSSLPPPKSPPAAGSKAALLLASIRKEKGEG